MYFIQPRFRQGLVLSRVTCHFAPSFSFIPKCHHSFCLIITFGVLEGEWIPTVSQRMEKKKLKSLKFLRPVTKLITTRFHFHLFRSILFYSILFYSILFYSIISYSILFCSILFCSILFYSVLFYSILFYSILFYPILSYPILSYSILFCSILFYSIHRGYFYSLKWSQNRLLFFFHSLIEYIYNWDGMCLLCSGTWNLNIIQFTFPFD